MNRTEKQLATLPVRGIDTSGDQTIIIYALEKKLSRMLLLFPFLPLGVSLFFGVNLLMFLLHIGYCRLTKRLSYYFCYPVSR